MKHTKFPAGWDDAKVRSTIGHYETQSEDDAVREDEESPKGSGLTTMRVPSELVPAVRSLMARRRRHPVPITR